MYDTYSIHLTRICFVTTGEAWNFVYGQAKPIDGVGAFSFARYQPGGNFALPFVSPVCDANYESGGSGGKAASTVDNSCRNSILYRSVKVLTHEIGHLFGIRHCIYYECLMAGCNHLVEFDKRPLHLCPIDLRKLQDASKFNIIERYYTHECTVCVCVCVCVWMYFV